MSFYQERIVPHLIHLAMRQRRLAAYRSRIVSGAVGDVLEVGIGSGLNLPFYGTGANHVIGLDPSSRLLTMAREAARRARPSLELVQGTAEAIPLEDRSVDMVVTTWTLCSIPDVGRALREMRRVLKPGGQLLFVEHGLAPDSGVRRWQDRLTPAWKRLGGGCHLNRAIGDLLENAGFQTKRLDRGYLGGRNPFAYMYEGSAGIPDGR